MASHQEFQPWDGSQGSRAEKGPDFVDDDGVADDCDGHGTHVASTAAGRSVGVAKEARVVAVRVLDCQGAGSISNVVAGRRTLGGLPGESIEAGEIAFYLQPAHVEPRCPATIQRHHLCFTDHGGLQHHVNDS